MYAPPLIAGSEKLGADSGTSNMAGGINEKEKRIKDTEIAHLND
jgi:hypothetical protein